MRDHFHVALKPSTTTFGVLDGVLWQDKEQVRLVSFCCSLLLTLLFTWAIPLSTAPQRSLCPGVGLPRASSPWHCPCSGTAQLFSQVCPQLCPSDTPFPAPPPCHFPTFPVPAGKLPLVRGQNEMVHPGAAGRARCDPEPLPQQTQGGCSLQERKAAVEDVKNRGSARAGLV